MTTMLSLRNHHELAEHAELVPLVEQIALCISSGSAVRGIERRDDPELKEMPGWIVFSDVHGRGIALNPSDFLPSKTPLRRHINFVQQAQKIVSGFTAANRPFPLFLREEKSCPSDWRVFQAHVRAGSFLCAASLPAPQVSFQGIRVARSTPLVRLPLAAEIAWFEDVAIGATQHISQIRVANQEQRIVGDIRISEDGVMTMQTVAALEEMIEGESPKAIMRVDIGEIQLALEELAALRNGSVIELDAQLPLKCFMRVGGTTLAEGELSLDESGLRVTIKDVIG
jgi:flagellar motor switch/type III secretory pathway protein FliN